LTSRRKRQGIISVADERARASNSTTQGRPPKELRGVQETHHRHTLYRILSCSPAVPDHTSSTRRRPYLYLRSPGPHSLSALY
ncbi:hypothetical protein KCU83_g310, partial [Aureobasidium melanogenum]